MKVEVDAFFLDFRLKIKRSSALHHTIRFILNKINVIYEE